ncbi:MAG: cation:proton antiporter [Vicinamibacterales bacterium]
MTVPLLFALVGSVILVGFLANLLFRVTKVPSVLLLVGLGVVLGPVTGLIRSDALLAIAPFFGAAALLVILFEGGLELEIVHVARHAPKTALLAAVVFALSLAGVAALAYVFLGFSLLTALMLGAILAATSPAICMPVVSGLSVRNDVKTVVKLESAMGEVLLIVSVVLLIESYNSGAADAMSWVWGLSRSLLVALVISTIAGVLWSRLVGWMGREPLSYMLTLGMVCLLYFAVEELGGSPAIAILLFGLLLANMQSIAGRFGPRFLELFGVNVREEQFVLGQFMVNITAELSFLVRTFFFVYLGLLLDFSALSWTLAAWTVAIFGLLLLSRRLGVGLFGRRAPSFSPAELQMIMALQPRGLATAVVAFLPMQAGVAGSDQFPVYAFAIIVLSNLYMTGGVLFAERQLRQAWMAPDEEPSAAGSPAAAAFPETAWTPTSSEILDAAAAAVPAALPPDVPARPPLFSPASDFADEPMPSTLTDWMARVFGLRRSDREAEYAEMIRASYISEPLFWVQAALAAVICALGLILDQTAIVIGAALIVPLVRPVIATGLALAAGDIYLLAKLLVKLLCFAAMVVGLSAVLIDLLPFGVATAEIAMRTRPTILDFLVALFGGMSGAALITLRRGTFHYLPGAVIAITLLPALCIMGFGLADNLGGAALGGGALQFTANLFAAVLGAGSILVLVGIPKAAQSPAIRQWKEEELARPLAQAIFGRLRLQHVIGRTGSVRARLVVVAIFLLALLIPLQLALNQLTMEYKTRQAISRAQAVFNIPDRSTVVGSSFTLGEHLVDVRVQVATNELFTASDIARFEERVSDQAGRRARLDLVQTVSDIGGAGTLRRLLDGRERTTLPPPVRTLSASLLELEPAVMRVVRELPLPETVRILKVRGDLASAAGPGLDIVYLAEAELGADARTMLVRLLASRTRIGEGRCTLRWVPSVVTVRVSRAGTVIGGDEPALRDLRAMLAEHPDLGVALELPESMPKRTAESARLQIQQELGTGELPVATAPPGTDRSTVRLRVSPRDDPS